MDKTKAVEVLNFYRNQHYNEPSGTEERELAEAINEILPHYVALLEQKQTFRVPSKDEWMERFCTPKQLAGYKHKLGGADHE